MPRSSESPLSKEAPNFRVATVVGFRLMLMGPHTNSHHCSWAKSWLAWWWRFEVAETQTGYDGRGEIEKEHMGLRFCSKMESSPAESFSFGTVTEVRCF